MKLLPVVVSLAVISAAAIGPAAAADDTDLFRRFGIDLPILTGQQLGQNGPGFLAGLAALLEALPPGNTVSIQIGEGAPQSVSGLGPQALSLSSGNVTASGSAGPGGASASVSMSNPTNSMTVNTSAGLGSAAASVHSGS